MRTLVGLGFSAIAVALLTSCSQSVSTSGLMPTLLSATSGSRTILPLVPPALVVRAKFHGRIAPASARRGIYVSEFFLTESNIIGYPKNNRSNGPAICTVSTGTNVDGVSTDARGHLIVANGSSGINVYKGPAMCGSLIGTIAYNGAGTAAATDAVNGPIVIGHTNGVGVCYLSDNECSGLKSPNLDAVASVAMDAKGNCYADAFDLSGLTGLWIYRKCRGTGTELTSANGFSEPYYGGITVDDRGNLVVVSLFNASLNPPSTVTVYSGCIKGTCTKLGGPFTFQGESGFAYLDQTGRHLVATDVSDGMVEIYKYERGTALTYLYSFDNGLSCITNLCEAATYSPSSPK